MEVHLTPEQEAKLAQLAATTGRNQAEIVGDALDTYLEELNDIQQMLDRRYDDFKSGRVKALTPDQLQENLNRRKAEFLRRKNEP
jgi:putative addiction module component (TIGR02574 family)